MKLKINKEIRSGGKLCLLLCGTLCAFTASATDWYTSPDGTGGGTSPTDRGEAITTMLKMASGDTLYFAPGTYNLDKSKSTLPNYGYGVYFMTPANISNLTFIGESDKPEDVRLVGKSSTDGMRIFYFQKGGHVLRNLLISGGYTSYQGAGLCMSDDFLKYPNGTYREVSDHEQAFTASNCIVENCSAAYQGANRGGVWYNCVIRNNELRNTVAAPPNPGPGNNEGSGGGVFNATLYDCVITNNTAGFCGGGIAGGRMNGGQYNTICRTMAYNCLIGWNSAPYGAGAGVTTSFTDRVYCQLYNCTVVSNTASMVGGGVYLCTVSNSVIRCNESTWNAAGSGSENGNGIHGYGGGGGVTFCDVFDSQVEANCSVRGGAGALLSNLVRCEILDNVATGFPNGYGGGTFACPLVKDCLLVGNKATYGGAGFICYFENCVMTNNQATGYDGGATYNSTSRNCIVVGNIATRYYAHCRGAHYGDLVYGNLNGNAGANGANGIGADSANADEGLPVVNCTVWNNRGGNAQVSRASLTNSIVQSVIDMDAHSAVNSFWRGGTVANQTGCISGTDKDPKFVGIDGTQNPTVSSKDAPWTAYMLRASSPCRDAGLLLPGQASETDVLGSPRVKYGMVDMGALECIQSLGTCFLFR